MLTAALYIFTFTSWGLGLLSALSALAMEIQRNSIRLRSAQIEIDTDALELQGRKSFVDRITAATPPMRKGMPDELKKLIESSPEHPEVNEIDEDDEVFGIVFKSHTYPPDMESNDD